MQPDRHASADVPPDERMAPAAGDGDEAAGAEARAAEVAALPIAGLTRGRLLAVAATMAALWIAIAFARQVGAAGELTARADALRAANADLERDVTALRDELALVSSAEYIAAAARAHRLGGPQEIPFTLGRGAPALGPDAPGSAAVRLGAELAASSPLESWLAVLFGPDG